MWQYAAHESSKFLGKSALILTNISRHNVVDQALKNLWTISFKIQSVYQTLDIWKNIFASQEQDRKITLWLIQIS